jgi:hypothetical protein
MVEPYKIYALVSRTISLSNISIGSAYTKIPRYHSTIMCTYGSGESNHSQDIQREQYIALGDPVLTKEIPRLPTTAGLPEDEKQPVHIGLPSAYSTYYLSDDYIGI